MDIDGQVTISLKTFNQLQDRAKQADELKKRMQDLQEEITDIIDQIDETEAKPIFREIDDSNMTDKQIQKRFDEAIAKFRIILDPEKTKRLIQKYIEKDRSDSHADVKNASRKVLEENEEMVQLIIANAYRDKTIADMLEEEKRLKESLQYMKDNGLTLQGYKLDSGRLRDVIASIMNTTGTKIAQIESINKHLIPEFSAELKEGRLTFSAAYEISGMAEDKQMELLEKYKEGGLSLKEVKQAKKEIEEAAEKAEIPGQMNLPEDPEEWEQEETEEEQEEEWQQAHPESITSLCYSCQRYSECNVKTGTCQDCDRYVDKADAEKTPEQRYDEEQAAIDRETAKKLTEMEQEEKMKNLPSDEKKARMMRVSAELFKDIKEGKIRHMIAKEDQAGYREKDILTLLAFRDGRSTGEQMRVCITCADDAQTSSAIIEGYAVIGIMDVYDAEALGLIDLGDED